MQWQNARHRFVLQYLQSTQLHGGYGYIREYGIERYFRDLRVHQILEGTNEIMRLIIAKQAISWAF